MLLGWELEGCKTGLSSHACGGQVCWVVRKCHFYEKVVKVKADVAVIFNFLSRFRRSGPTITTRVPGGTLRGDAQGQRSALKPTLRGEPRHRCVPALFAGAQRANGLGGTRPPRLSPGAGNGKGGVQSADASISAPARSPEPRRASASASSEFLSSGVFYTGVAA